MSFLRIVASTALVVTIGLRPALAQAPDAPVGEDQELAPVDVFQGAGILIAESEDHRFRWWLDGRVNLDTAFYFNSDSTLGNGVELRRGRVALNMVLWSSWAAQFDIDFVENAVDVKDAWIGYTGFERTLVRAGNFRAPFGLETLTSSRYITFMERSLIDNFSPDRRMGIGVSRWGTRWQAAGGFFGPALEDTIERTGQDQTYSVIGRVTGLPVAEGNRLVHVGAAFAVMQPNAAVEDDLSDANRWRVRARPETHVSLGRFLNTGQVRNVDRAVLYGVEAAATYGSFSAQAEYNRETLQRTVDGLPEPAYDGWYAFASWFPTGDHRPYDRTAGEFTRVVPKGPRGAVEVVARYSTLDLNDFDAGIRGGREGIVTLGVNWYANANVRLMTNYLFVNNDVFARGDYLPNDDFNVLQMRLALMF
ncbi:MAG: OprO/OprP family phosphate-selective porin [Vicinamibacterales bacterium]